MKKLSVMLMPFVVLFVGVAICEAQCLNKYGAYVIQSDPCPKVQEILSDEELKEIKVNPFKRLTALDREPDPQTIVEPGVYVKHRPKKKECAVATEIKVFYKHQITLVPLDEIEFYIHKEDQYPFSEKMNLLAKCRDGKECIKLEERMGKRTEFKEELYILNEAEPLEEVNHIVASLRDWQRKNCKN